MMSNNNSKSVLNIFSNLANYDKISSNESHIKMKLNLYNNRNYGSVEGQEYICEIQENMTANEEEKLQYKEEKDLEDIKEVKNHNESESVNLKLDKKNSELFLDKTNIKNMKKLINDLEESLMLSHNEENKLILDTNCTKQHNKKLEEQINRVNKKNKNLVNLFRQNEPFSKSRKKNKVKTNNEALSQAVEELKEILIKRGNQLNMFKTEISVLKQNINDLQEKLYERDKTIENLCLRFLNMKTRKESQITALQNTVNSLEDTLNEALKKSKKNCEQKTSVLSKQLTKTHDSKDALLLVEKRRNTWLEHENLSLKLDKARTLKDLKKVEIRKLSIFCLSHGIGKV